MNADAAAALNWYLLPDTIRQVAERCGHDVAVALLEHCNNRRIWIPLPGERPGRGNNPLRAMPQAMIDKLAAHYPGQPMIVPGAYHALLALRNEAIRAEREAKVPIAELAERYGMSERWIWEIVGPNEKDARQPDLF